MKQIIAMLLLGISTSFIFAQKIKEDKVPVAVVSAFKKQYPQVTNAEWENEKGDYEAGFELNKTETSVLYNAQGNLKETEAKIEMNKLPTKRLKSTSSRSRYGKCWNLESL